jgi:V8-like Glu-specific endopeptidase
MIEQMTMSPIFSAGLRSKRLIAMTALAIAGLAALWASDARAANPAGVKSFSATDSAAQIKRIKNYWTPQRMRHATPLNATPTRREVAEAARATARTSARGKVKAVQPTLGRASSGVVEGPIPYATPINNPTVYPYRTQGKVFFKQGGGNYVCSATVVNTPNKRVVFTAGHCVYDPGSQTVSTNFSFVPGYRNGTRPYGTFVATKLFAPTGWIQAEDFSYDMAAAVLGGAKQVATTVGSRGIKFNLARQQNFVSFGYPAAAPFNGETLYSCPSPYKGQDPTTSNPRTQWITCNMTGGSSGGGWIVQSKYLNSVNSYGYTSQPNRMYGPYFGTAAVNLYNGVKNQTP